MDNKIIVGIPRGLLYHKYETLWKVFFKELGCDVLISPETNLELFEKGTKLSEDEFCLSLKIYIGHVDYLKDKVDYVLVPKIISIDENIEVCDNFNMLYDIVNNIFDIDVISYTVDIKKRKTEELGFIKMGESLGFGKTLSSYAYKTAKKEQYKEDKIKYLVQEKKINRDKLKVLLVSNSYNSYDKTIGKAISKTLNDLKCDTIYNCINNPDITNNLYEDIPKACNKELLDTINEYKNSVNGIVLLSTYPCDLEILCNEIISRKIDIPLITILVSELPLNEKIKKELKNFIHIVRGDVYD